MYLLTFYLVLVFDIGGGRLDHLGQQQPDTLSHQLVGALGNGQEACYTFKRSRRPQYSKYLKFKSSCSQGLVTSFLLVL